MKIGRPSQLLFSFFAWFSSSCSLAHEMRPSGIEVESLKAQLQKLNLGTSTKYTVAFYNLNHAGNLEAIVYLLGPTVCGSGGCNTVVLSYNHKWSVVSTIHLTRLPIKVMAETYNGWHSIGVNVFGGGVLHPYVAQLNFDGKSYPENPTMPPAVRVNESEGKVIISSLSRATDLYHH